ncbi:MAG: hypothetical protein ACLU80_10835 [Dorea sp.]
MKVCVSVIELRRDVNANVLLNQLYKHTQLQDTFGVIMLALVDKRAKGPEYFRDAWSIT